MNTENAEQSLSRREFISKSTLATAALAGASLLPSPAFAAGLPRVNRNKVRVGLIGCGSVSNPYPQTLTKHPTLEVVSVCDIIPERAKKRAEQHNVANFYPHIDAMLAGAEFDMLVNKGSGQFTPEVSIEPPEALRECHREFLNAGSQVLQSPTFFGTREKLNRAGCGADTHWLRRRRRRLQSGLYPRAGGSFGNGEWPMSQRLDPSPTDVEPVRHSAIRH